MMHFEQHIREATKIHEVKSESEKKINFECWYPNEEARKEAERKEKIKKVMCGELPTSALGFVPYKKK